MKVTITHGLDNSITRNVADGTTVDDILGDAALAQVLGFSDNVVGYIDGAEVGNDTELEDGDTLTLRAKAGSKG